VELSKQFTLKLFVEIKYRGLGGGREGRERKRKGDRYPKKAIIIREVFS